MLYSYKFFYNFCEDKMKSDTKSKTTFLIILGTIFAFSILINAKFSYFGGNNSENLEVNIESNLKEADYWVLTGAPIFIDDSNPNYNWSKTANENDWCNGNGSLSNPYIIENVTIDATSSPTGCGIYVNNSQTEYFTIRNVTVYNAGSGYYDAGFKLENTNNGTLMNNTFSNNYRNGIFLDGSNNNILSGNTANDNSYSGINLKNSNNNTLSGNTANNNDYRGITLEDSNNNNISGNTASYNFYYGIYLEDGSANTLSGNSMNECGLRLLGSYEVLCSHHIDNTNLVNGKPLYYYTNEVDLDPSNFTNAGQVILVNCNDSSILNLNTSYSTIGISLYYCNNNNISGNTANNNVDYGIYLYDSNDNTISGNTVIHNLDAGIHLSWSDNNTISGNTANDNYYGIHLSGSDNNTISGNSANDNYFGIYLEDGSYITLSGNTANYNSWRGIYLHNSNNNTLSGNSMNECGVDLSGSYGMLCSHHIDNTNLVNGKPLYYYKNEVNLDSSNFTNAGQVILVNCNDSSILNLNTSYSTIGISLYYCNYNTISGNRVNYNIWTGIYLSYCNTNTISGNTARANYRGIELFRSDYNTISGNTANDNDLNGIQLYRSDYNTISGNTADDNDDRGIVLGNSNNNNISGNTAYHNYYHGIALYDSNNNDISGNTACYSRFGISLHESNNNDITGNTLIGNYECIFEDNCQGNTFSDNGRCKYGQGGNDIIPGYNLFLLLGFLSLVAIVIGKKVKKS